MFFAFGAFRMKQKQFTTSYFGMSDSVLSSISMGQTKCCIPLSRKKVLSSQWKRKSSFRPHNELVNCFSFQWNLLSPNTKNVYDWNICYIKPYEIIENLHKQMCSEGVLTNRSSCPTVTGLTPSVESVFIGFERIWMLRVLTQADRAKYWNHFTSRHGAQFMQSGFL